MDNFWFFLLISISVFFNSVAVIGLWAFVLANHKDHRAFLKSVVSEFKRCWTYIEERKS